MGMLFVTRKCFHWQGNWDNLNRAWFLDIRFLWMVESRLCIGIASPSYVDVVLIE